MKIARNFAKMTVFDGKIAIHKLAVYEDIRIFKQHFLIYASTNLAAASSQMTVTSGWNCRMEPGTSGFTGPKKT